MLSLSLSLSLAGVSRALLRRLGADTWSPTLGASGVVCFRVVFVQALREPSGCSDLGVGGAAGHWPRLPVVCQMVLAVWAQCLFLRDPLILSPESGVWSLKRQGIPWWVLDSSRTVGTSAAPVEWAGTQGHPIHAERIGEVHRCQNRDWSIFPRELLAGEGPGTCLVQVPVQPVPSVAVRGPN